MVKIVNGEIVADDDPRAAHLVNRGQQQPKSSNNNPRQGGIGSWGSGGGGNASQAGGSKGNVHGQGPTPSSIRTDGFSENVIAGDLAKALGIYGKRVDILGYDVPMIYALVGGTLAALYFTGQTDIMKMLVLAFVVYVVGCQIANLRKSGVSMEDILKGNAGKGPAGGTPGSAPQDHKNDFGGAKPYKRPGQ